MEFKYLETLIAHHNLVKNDIKVQVQIMNVMKSQLIQ